MRSELSGIIAPITTPFQDEEVNLQWLRSNVRRYAQTPLASLFVLGSNGEGKFLSESEKIRVIETVAIEKSPQQSMLVNVGAESTRLTIEAAVQAASLGADFVSVITPSYFKNRYTDQVLSKYYLDIADASPVPVVVYNIPANTGIALPVKVIELIASHPNIAGVKDSSPGQYVDYLQVCGENFSVLSGTINTLLQAMVLGARGGVVSLADSFPELCCKLYDLICHREIERAVVLNRKLLKLNKVISGAYGVAGVKYAAELRGYFGGKPRLPLLPLDDQDKDRIRQAITDAQLDQPSSL